VGRIRLLLTQLNWLTVLRRPNAEFMFEMFGVVVFWVDHRDVGRKGIARWVARLIARSYDLVNKIGRRIAVVIAHEPRSAALLFFYFFIYY